MLLLQLISCLIDCCCLQSIRCTKQGAHTIAWGSLCTCLIQVQQVKIQHFLGCSVERVWGKRTLIRRHHYRHGKKDYRRFLTYTFVYRMTIPPSHRGGHPAGYGASLHVHSASVEVAGLENVRQKECPNEDAETCLKLNCALLKGCSRNNPTNNTIPVTAYLCSYLQILADMLQTNSPIP